MIVQPTNFLDNTGHTGVNKEQSKNELYFLSRLGWPLDREILATNAESQGFHAGALT
jgi:hypothetical protein